MDLARTARPTPRPDCGWPHRIIRIRERQGVPVLADCAYVGAGSWVTPTIRRLPHQDLNPTQRTISGVCLRHEHRSNEASRD